MQYTIRGIHPALDTALRQRARAEGRGLNEVTAAVLPEGIGVVEQDRVDPDLWR